MSERELLELAAKAAGLALRWERDPAFIQERWVAYVPCGWAGQPSEREWNPLRESGDALDLAVRLRADIFHGADGVMAFVSRNHPTRYQTEEPYGDDPRAATCRAVVRVAAEIGRATP